MAVRPIDMVVCYLSALRGCLELDFDVFADKIETGMERREM